MLPHKLQSLEHLQGGVYDSFETFDNRYASWWFQPIWKKCQIGSFPLIGVKIKKMKPPPSLCFVWFNPPFVKLKGLQITLSQLPHSWWSYWVESMASMGFPSLNDISMVTPSTLLFRFCIRAEGVKSQNRSLDWAVIDPNVFFCRGAIAIFVPQIKARGSASTLTSYGTTEHKKHPSMYQYETLQKTQNVRGW